MSGDTTGGTYALSLNLLFKDVFSITTKKVAVKSLLCYQLGYLIFI
jgi:hypothetical protein